MRPVAALYVEPNGPYYGLRGIDPWDKQRDARKYHGPHPVIAHPPCERWGRYWSGGPSASYKRKLGDDDGCFKAALHAVRTWGGVLEHPEGSHAFKKFLLPIPDFWGGWTEPDLWGGSSCCVSQGHYGHRARKLTLLYAVGTKLPELHWGPAVHKIRLDDGFKSTAERRRAARTTPRKRLSLRQRLLTPEPFRDLLIEIARSA